MTTVEALPPERPIHGQMVLLPTPPPGGFTAADLPRLIEAVDARFELLDGEVLVMAPATHWHDEVMDILKHALRRIAPQALVVATEKGIDLGRTVPEPDVLVVSRAVVTSGSLVFQPSDVHLTIEVVSPGTTTKDRTLRPAQYASAGIKCFWRVENEDDAMVVYTFELLPEGGYAPTGVFRGRVKVDRPFPIDIDLPEVTWLSGRQSWDQYRSGWIDGRIHSSHHLSLDPASADNSSVQVRGVAPTNPRVWASSPCTARERPRRSGRRGMMCLYRF